MKYLANAMGVMKRAVANIKSTALDIISSISADGKTANVETYKSSELRDLKIMLPYGIASTVQVGMQVQVMLNEDGTSGTIVGIYDDGRPAVKPGEIVIYSQFGSSIKLAEDGNIYLIPKSGHATKYE